MLIAKTKQGVETLATDAVKSDSYYCGGCGKPVVLKRGHQKEAHFAHKMSPECQLFSESETAEHLVLKKFFKKWLGEQAILEAYLPKLKQRPDILVPKQRLAIEIQYSVLSIESLTKRVNAYFDQNYDNWWIMGTRFLKRPVFSQLEKSCCMYTKQRGVHFWQADAVTKQLHLFHHIIESPLCKMRYRQSTWSFFEIDLLSLKQRPIVKYNAQNDSKTRYLQRIDYYRWLKQLLYRKQKRILTLQEQCYLRGKHLLHLSKWMYSKSRYFFFYQEKLFYCRLVFEETFQSDKAVHYRLWEKEIKKQIPIWLFPLVNEKQMMKEVFEECTRLIRGCEQAV